MRPILLIEDDPSDDAVADDELADGDPAESSDSEPAGKGAGNPDGMKFDVRGNLYSVGPGGIWVFNPAGKQIGMIVPPETAPGFTFGHPDGKSIYMAATSKLARIKVNIAGAR